ncbi:MAG: beta-ketoacyl synthase N-terminal-like domain-containing protein [Thermoanaerobaculia bacterium]
MRRVVVTGVSAVTPLGRDLAATREALSAGRSALAYVVGPDVPAGRPDHSPAARIVTFTTEPELPRSKARRLDRASQYAVVAARQALASAAYAMAGREERTGILLGTGSAGAGPLVEFERQMAIEGPDSASPFLFPYTVSNAPASVVAIELQIRGPNVTITQKDPAALNALLYARLLLEGRRADALLVGASDEWDLEYHLAYERIHATRTARRAGFVLGEGAAFLLVEDEEAARRRGASVKARLASVVTRPVAVSPQLRRADPRRLEITMRAALDEAGVTPATVGLVHLSKNGVAETDEGEARAMKQVFPSPPRTAAVKEALGENPAIGAVQLALAAEELSEHPGTGAVLVNAFGAGGNFLCAVLTAP